MEPFILNIANNGEPKYLKVSIALELANASLMEMVKVAKSCVQRCNYCSHFVKDS